MSANDWQLHIPDYTQKPLITSKKSTTLTPGDGKQETILDCSMTALMAHPRTRMRLRDGRWVLSSMPTGSSLTEDVLRTAIRTADQCYSHELPLGRQLSADRIQRLVLGVAELFQAELLADSSCTFDQLEDEFSAASRCLRAGYRCRVDGDAQNAPVVGDTEHDADDDQ